MTRIKSFDAPHKGLRSALSKFSLLAGKTNYADLEQLTELKKTGNELFILLNDHVHTENEFVLKPLEERVPGAAGHDLHDHEELENIQKAVEMSLNRFDGTQDADQEHQFYLEFSGFHSRYLDHILHEESVTEKLLQDNFSDEELIEHRIQTMQRIAFPTMLLWFKYIIPAQRQDENIRMLLGFKANVPKEAFNAVSFTIQAEMSKNEFNNLLSKL